MISDDEFIGLHRAEFARAARLQYRILYVQVATAVLACFAVYLSDAAAAYLLAVLTGIAAFVWAYLARAYRSSRSLAERVRRATVITSAFAAPISAPDKRDVMTRFSVSAAEGQRFTDTDYYAADDPPGVARLAAIIEESAFWSCVLLRKSADRTWSCLRRFSRSPSFWFSRRCPSSPLRSGSAEFGCFVRSFLCSYPQMCLAPLRPMAAQPKR